MIRGVVVEDGTGEPIRAVAVEALRHGNVVAAAETDARGNFSLSLPGADRYQIRFAHVGYVAMDPVDVRVSRADTLRVELRMGRTTIPLQPIVVAPERDIRLAGFYERMRRPGAGQFLTQSEIERRPGARTSDLLRQLPGVEIVRSGRANMVRIRGNVRCDPTIYVDGQWVRQYPESTVDDFLRPETLAGVEVYTSAASAPPPIIARGDCGVVAFWTRPVEQGEPWSLRRVLIGAAALAGLLTIIVLTR